MANQHRKTAGHFGSMGAAALCLLVILGAPSPAQAERADALVLGKANSPVLDQLREDTNVHPVDPQAAAGADPADYGMLILDGDQLSPEDLRRRPTIERFANAGDWVVVLDAGRQDMESIKTHTGFGVSEHPSDLLMFRVGREQGSPMIEVVDGGTPGVDSERKLNDRRHDRLRGFEVLRAAGLVAGRTGLEVSDPGLARTAYENATNKVPCTALNPVPDPDLQHIGWCYTSIGSEVPPDGQFKKEFWWIDSFPTPGWQTASWTMNHRFDVFLSNDKDHPRGNFQEITYGLDGQFAPKRATEPFYRMFDKFSSGWAGKARVVERAWWTGRADPSVKPKPGTKDRLIFEHSQPESANSETNYTSGEDFSVGFSGTIAKPDGGLGIGLNVGYTSSNSKSYSIPDWRVQNKSSGRDLNWSFSSRNPCDTSIENEGKNLLPNCFTDKYEFGGNIHEPAVPNEISRSNLQFKATGRWRTDKLLEPGAAPLSIAVDVPVRLFDTYCSTSWNGGAGFCPFGIESGYGMAGHTTGPKQFTAEIQADWVDPVGIDSLQLSKSRADGGKNDRVTGTVTLQRASKVPVDVRVFSRNPNAVLANPFPGVTDGSQDTVKIDPGKTTGQFTIYTNANKLSPGESSTALINAFYTEPVKPQELVVERSR